jgi:hypothetical protein
MLCGIGPTDWILDLSKMCQNEVFTLRSAAADPVRVRSFLITMAGTIQPIAELTADDRGPINTIVSIVLPSISVIFCTIRMAVCREKHIRLELDDSVYGLALVSRPSLSKLAPFSSSVQCFGITFSILSHFCVRSGLGRHQNTLDDQQLDRYFKVRHYFTDRPLQCQY